MLLRILEFERRGGPCDADFARARATADVIAEHGDVLQFGGKKKGAHNIGSAAHAFNELAFALAVMAFVPGGVSFAGQRYAAPSAGRSYEPAPISGTDGG